MCVRLTVAGCWCCGCTKGNTGQNKQTCAVATFRRPTLCYSWYRTVRTSPEFKQSEVTSAGTFTRRLKVLSGLQTDVSFCPTFNKLRIDQSPVFVSVAAYHLNTKQTQLTNQTVYASPFLADKTASSTALD